MSDTAEEKPRRGRGRRRRAGLLVLFSVALLSVFGGLGFLAVTGIPLTAPDWVTREMEERLNAEIETGRVSLGGISVGVDSGMVPRVRLRNVGLIDGRGLEVARLNEVSAALTAPALLQGTVQMSSVQVSGAQITVRRLSDGTFDLSFGEGLGASGTLAGVLDRIDAAFEKPPLAGMRRIEANQLTITLEDARSGRLWQVTEGRIVLEPGANTLGLTVTADVFNGTEDLATLVLTMQTEKGTSQASLDAVFQNAATADIAAQAPALAFLEVLDAPIAGALSAQIGPDGQMTGLEGALDIGAGVLQPTPETEPIRFDGASGRMAYDAARQQISVEDLQIQTGAAQGRAEGQAFLRDFENGWPATMVGQYRLTDVVVQPEGLFPEPVGFAEGAIDFRVRLDPFSVEIGQISLVDEDRRIHGYGNVRATRGGWDAALDLALEPIGLDRLLAIWPVSVAPKPREWLEKNVFKGTVADMAAALRVSPERPDGDFSLSFSFLDADLKPMKTLPPINGASGYASLVGQTFTATLESGQVAAPQGGMIDVTGTSFKVPNIKRKPGRGEVTLQTDSSIEAALSLLDLPPFELMTKAGRPPDLFTGRAETTTEIGFDLVKRVQVEDVDYNAAATLTNVFSATLIPGRELRSDRLELRANPGGVAVSGTGFLGELPANVVWSQQFGPEHAGESTVEGTVQLGEAFLSEFGIGLPPNAITGDGLGTITVNLKKDEPPTFRLVSDLNRMGMRIDALGWSKAVNRTGRLEVAGTLGQEPGIDQLVLEAPGLSLSGVIDLGPDGALQTASFDRVRVGNWLDGPVILTGRGPGRPPGVTMTRGTVDLRQANLGGSGGGGGGQGGREGSPLSLQLDRLIVSEGIAFTSFVGQFRNRGGLEGRFAARINGGAGVSGDVIPTPSGAAIRLISEDAGGALASAGVLKTARGGRLDLTLNPTGQDGVYDGYLRVRDTRIVDAPAMTDLLSAISIVGLIDQFNTGGITFNEVDAEFRLTPSRLTLLRSSGVGPSLGLSLDGIFDLASGRLDMQGVVSPVYFLNGIGQVVSRRGEGLFGFSFRMRGEATSPSVSVNPLSILTPGMFRDIFRRPPPTQ
ncbi:hypothetical protein [Psychromarinibacter halotolerans]|uniref:AsmA-like protein n=1 Tax=Psychromarinibacter halotolerans TaxID=1775175 RepID=A0ABV7GZ75_9RHOB|nr:hypothetical protein [Psychromarinibacter halotolerans]MDF0598161.1 hypothetical protein [Psychromarinibacter halotolerans]